MEPSSQAGLFWFISDCWANFSLGTVKSIPSMTLQPSMKSFLISFPSCTKQRKLKCQHQSWQHTPKEKVHTELGRILPAEISTSWKAGKLPQHSQYWRFKQVYWSLEQFYCYSSHNLWAKYCMKIHKPENVLCGYIRIYYANTINIVEK